MFIKLILYIVTICFLVYLYEVEHSTSGLKINDLNDIFDSMIIIRDVPLGA